MMGTRMREDDVRKLAIAHGVPANDVVFADTAEAAERVAFDLGRSVVLKLVADDVVHKSKAGGVLLGVEPNQVRARTEQLFADQTARGMTVRGVTVEAMVDAGLEVVVGGLRTEHFGPVVMFGHGGVDIETLDDVVFALAPIDDHEARRMIGRTRVGAIIETRYPERTDDIVGALLAVGGATGMLATEPITEVDLNPMVVTESRVVAVDARATRLGDDDIEPLVGAESTTDHHACTDAYESLRAAIYPDSIAVVGASADERKMGHRAVRTLTDFGYDGALHPVSRSSESVCGVPTVCTIGDLPAGVDRAVVALPAAAVPAALDSLAERGVRIAHVLTADTPALDPSLRARGLRVVGPNCIGHYAPGKRITMIDAGASQPIPGSIAVVSQSGTYAGDILRRGTQLGLHFSFVSSIGNCDDVSPAEFLAFCEADDDTRVIAFYLEGDRGAGDFFRIAATAVKPVILLHGGRTATGGAAAASHTGALAGDPQLLEDAAQQSGVVMVDDLDQLLDVLSLYEHVQGIDGDGLAIVGSGGGVAVVGSDQADRWNLTVPALSSSSAEALQRFSAPGSSIHNPVDIPIWSLFEGEEPFTGAIVAAVSADASVDVVCAFLDLGTVFDMQDAERGRALVRLLTTDLVDGARKDTPLALVLRSGFDRSQDDLVRELRPAVAAAGVPLFDSVDRAVAAIGRVRAITRDGERGAGRVR